MASNSRQPTKKQKTEKSASDETKLQEVYQQLEDVQDKLEKINDDAAEEIIKIEKKYNEKRAPYYKERNDVIKKIPGFWKKTFMHHDVLCDCLSENDQQVFDYVTELYVEDFDDVQGSFKIIFKFKTNPWFKNDTLSKEFRYNEEGNLSVEATKIEWKHGEDPFKEAEQESFFSMWFKTDEEDAAGDEVANIIKDEIWPDPSKYFHGFEELPGEHPGEDSDE